MLWHQTSSKKNPSPDKIQRRKGQIRRWIGPAASLPVRFVGPPAPAIYLPSLVGFFMGAESEQKLWGDVSQQAFVRTFFLPDAQKKGVL